MAPKRRERGGCKEKQREREVTRGERKHSRVDGMIEDFSLSYLLFLLCLSLAPPSTHPYGEMRKGFIADEVKLEHHTPSHDRDTNATFLLPPPQKFLKVFWP